VAALFAPDQSAKWHEWIPCVNIRLAGVSRMLLGTALFPRDKDDIGRLHGRGQFIRDDGNCLFDSLFALSQDYLLRGDPDQWSRERNEGTRALREDLHAYINEEWDKVRMNASREEVNGIQKDGGWGGEIAIAAYAEMNEVCVRVYDAAKTTPSRWPVVYNPDGRFFKTYVFELAYFQNHYMPVVEWREGNLDVGMMGELQVLKCLLNRDIPNALNAFRAPLGQGDIDDVLVRANRKQCHLNDAIEKKYLGDDDGDYASPRSRDPPAHQASVLELLSGAPRTVSPPRRPTGPATATAASGGPQRPLASSGPQRPVASGGAVSLLPVNDVQRVDVLYVGRLETPLLCRDPLRVEANVYYAAVSGLTTKRKTPQYDVVVVEEFVFTGEREPDTKIRAEVQARLRKSSGILVVLSPTEKRSKAIAETWSPAARICDVSLTDPRRNSRVFAPVHATVYWDAKPRVAMGRTFALQATTSDFLAQVIGAARASTSATADVPLWGSRIQIGPIAAARIPRGAETDAGILVGLAQSLRDALRGTPCDERIEALRGAILANRTQESAATASAVVAKWPELGDIVRADWVSMRSAAGAACMFIPNAGDVYNALFHVRHDASMEGSVVLCAVTPGVVNITTGEVLERAVVALRQPDDHSERMPPPDARDRAVSLLYVLHGLRADALCESIGRASIRVNAQADDRQTPVALLIGKKEDARCPTRADAFALRLPTVLAEITGGGLRQTPVATVSELATAGVVALCDGDDVASTTAVVRDAVTNALWWRAVALDSVRT